MKHNISELPLGSHIHIMGICGTAMGNFAGLLQSLGYKITGSDKNIYPPMSDVLQSLGIEIFQGYKKENLIPKPDFVVVGNVISRHMEEAEALLASDIPYASFPESIGDLLLSKTHSIVVAGTHGKTTTSSMMAWIATQVGLQPGYLIGGVPKNFASSFARGGGKYFVIEGDEYDTAFFDKVPKFKHYHPRSAILTSVEFDHADIYANLEAVLKAFKILMEKLPSDGHLIYHFADKNIQSLLPFCKATTQVSYGFDDMTGDVNSSINPTQNSIPDFAICNLHYTEQLTQWDVRCRWQGNKKTNTENIYHLQCAMSGDHNVLNFTADFALAMILGWPTDVVIKAIAEFQGVKRRQEILANVHGITVVEDFAHHPTAVKTTLEGLKKKYVGRRLLAAFEPRSATSRKSVFQKDYVKAFDHVADEIFIMQAYTPEGKEVPADAFSSQTLVDDLKILGNKSYMFSSYEDLVVALLQTARPNDVLVLMSNGGFGGIYPKIIAGLEKAKR